MYVYLAFVFQVDIELGTMRVRACVPMFVLMSAVSRAVSSVMTVLVEIPHRKCMVNWDFCVERSMAFNGESI